MTRSLKVLGLVSAAALALGVLVSSGTQASETPELTASKTTTGQHQEVTIFGNGKNEQFHGFGLSVTCETTAWGAEAQEPQTVPRPQFTVKPFHRVCKAPFAKAVTVETHKCGFQFNIGATTAAHTYNGTVDLECENANEAFEIYMWFGSKEHGKDPPNCVVKVKPQTGAGVTYKSNTGTPHDLLIYGKLENLHVERSGTAILCGNGTTEEAEYTFPEEGATIFVRNAAGEDINAWID